MVKDIRLLTNYDASYSALIIAKYVISECYKQGKPVTNTKLQKILFMIQKEYLKCFCLCFYENIEAWEFGPCIPKVYYRYCGCGVMPIRIDYREEVLTTLIDKKDRLIISSVVNKYINKENLLWEFPLVKRVYEVIPHKLLFYEEILKEKDCDKRTKEKYDKRATCKNQCERCEP